MTEWHEWVPVVRVRAGLGDVEPQVYTGYSATVENSGAVVIFQVEPQPMSRDGAVRRKSKGKCIALANGMWEIVEQEWEPVGDGGLRVQ
jgi:hypothetical protein